MQTPNFKPCKGEILKKVAQRFSQGEWDINSIEALSELQYASKAITARLNQELAKSGLSEAKFFVLLYLLMEDVQEHEAPGPSGIAENVGVTRATITGLLDGLERDGFIVRHHDPRDRRAIAIHLADKGQEFLQGFVPTQEKMMRETFGPLTADERRTLATLLRKMDLHGAGGECEEGGGG